MLTSLLRSSSLIALALLAACTVAPAPIAPTAPPGSAAAAGPGAEGVAKAGADQGEFAAQGAPRAAGARAESDDADGVIGEGAPLPAGAPAARGRGFGGAAPEGAPGARAPAAPAARGPGALAPAAAPLADAGPDVAIFGPVPVTSADPSWGNRAAPVTVVAFSDLQCPFCAKAAETLHQLQKDYGPAQLRVVWKNNPLSFHADARRAAETAMALFELRGEAAFWSYTDAVFQGNAPTRFTDAITAAGGTVAEVNAAIAKGRIGAKIEADLALGKRTGVTGTPAFFINGVFLSGAQPIAQFKEIIDGELKQARELGGKGVAADRIYVEASKKNFEPVKPATITPKADDKAAYRVPVGTSPVRGKPTALVTLVLFADFQCPFCVKVEPTITQLEQAYGDKLRVVWKNNPLPFHGRAEPAAQLAMEARAQKGDAGFWKVHDLLVTQDRALEAKDLEGVAKAAGLDVAAAMRAVDAHKHRDAIEQDQELADELKAGGTPTSFVNGRMLVGAQPFEAFKEVIDEELVVAQAAVAKGTAPAKLYETLQLTAKGPEPLEMRTVPAPTKDNPTKGPANAKVIVHVFGDFQCPFCSKVELTLADLDKAFPGTLRFVWHNLPLQMHPHAQLTAEAAVEAFQQKGAAGFWAMHDKLFENQSAPNGLERKALDQYAVAIGLDPRGFAPALDAHTHKAAVEAEITMAERAGINGTPGFVIDGAYISGAQGLGTFKRAVRRALAAIK